MNIYDLTEWQLSYGSCSLHHHNHAQDLAGTQDYHARRPGEGSNGHFMRLAKLGRYSWHCNGLVNVVDIVVKGEIKIHLLM